MEEITIGYRFWSVKNLYVDTFRNGDPIPHAETDEEWEEASENGEPAWCYYDNDPANGEKYGKLYNWHAVNDPRGLAPEGWHIPSEDEWSTLKVTANLLGGSNNTCGRVLKSTIGWEDSYHDGTSGNGTNESGFAGLPGGDRSSNGTFDYIGKFGFWWSSSEYTELRTRFAWSRDLYYYNGSVHRHRGIKEEGFSVRCLRD